MNANVYILPGLSCSGRTRSKISQASSETSQRLAQAQMTTVFDFVSRILHCLQILLDDRPGDERHTYSRQVVVAVAVVGRMSSSRIRQLEAGEAGEAGELDPGGNPHNCPGSVDVLGCVAMQAVARNSAV